MLINKQLLFRSSTHVMLVLERKLLRNHPWGNQNSNHFNFISLSSNFAQAKRPLFPVKGIITEKQFIYY